MENKKEFPTLRQYIDYLESLTKQFGDGAIIKVKTALGFNEAGAMIIDDDTPAMMASANEDGATEIYIMALELQQTLFAMMNQSEADGEDEPVKENKSSKIITSSDGSTGGKKNKIII